MPRPAKSKALPLAEDATGTGNLPPRDAGLAQCRVDDAHRFGNDLAGDQTREVHSPWVMLNSQTKPGTRKRSCM